MIDKGSTKNFFIISPNFQVFIIVKKWLGVRLPSHLKTLVDYSHSLKLALSPVNLGLFARFIGGFDRLFPLRLWSLRKIGIKMVSQISFPKHNLLFFCFTIKSNKCKRSVKIPKSQLWRNDTGKPSPKFIELK
jgi:hypothetical protein